VGFAFTLRELSSDGDLELEPVYSSLPSGYNRFFMRLPSAGSGERLWGGGEQYSYFDLTGRDWPMWVREQGFGRDPNKPLYGAIEAVLPGVGGDYHTTYWPQPTFLSSERYYFELTLPTYSELRLESSSFDPEGRTVYWHRNHVEGEECELCDIKFIVRDSLLEVVQAINPGQPPLPDWIHDGAILGVQGGTDLMLDFLDRAEDAGVEVSGMWIQDWSGKITTDFGTRVFWNWRWNETWYPNLDVTIQDLRARDVRVLVYMTGHLNIEGDVYQDGERENFWLTTDRDERLVQDFGEFFVATVDLTPADPSCNCENPARAFYKDIMRRNALDLGVAGWMADFGEYTPTEARSAYAAPWWGEEDGKEILHQTYAENWASLNRELLEENNVLDEVFFFMRSGGKTSKNFQMASWAGDQNVDWTDADGLKSSIIAALSLGE